MKKKVHTRLTLLSIIKVSSVKLEENDNFNAPGNIPPAGIIQVSGALCTLLGISTMVSSLEQNNIECHIEKMWSNSLHIDL